MADVAAERVPLHDSLKEYALGITGGLVFSLPLLYTMEVWWTGFIASPQALVVYVGFTFLLLLAYNRFAGLHPAASFGEVVVDSVEEMGLGLVIAFVMLFLVGQIDPGMPVSEVIGKIVVEGMTVAIGVSVGTAQLGSGSADEDRRHQHRQRQEKRGPHFWQELTMAVCGAVLIAANIAPTEEVLKIAMASSPARILGIAAFSLVMVFLILEYGNFRGARKMSRQQAIPPALFSAVTTYAVALLVSAFQLSFFHGFEGTSLGMIVSMTVVLGFAASLGSSAGRLLLGG